MSETCVITIEAIDKRDNDYVHFASADGRKWNYKYNPQYDSTNIGPHLKEGLHLEIEYREAQNKQGGTSKWVNGARATKSPDTWQRKEPYTGGGSMSGKKDFDPATSLRQTSANCATNIIADKKDAGTAEWDTWADHIHSWLTKTPGASLEELKTKAVESLGATPEKKDDDEEFPF